MSTTASSVLSDEIERVGALAAKEAEARVEKACSYADHLVGGGSPVTNLCPDSWGLWRAFERAMGLRPNPYPPHKTESFLASQAMIERLGEYMTVPEIHARVRELLPERSWVNPKFQLPTAISAGTLRFSPYRMERDKMDGKVVYRFALRDVKRGDQVRLKATRQVGTVTKVFEKGMDDFRPESTSYQVETGEDTVALQTEIERWEAEHNEPPADHVIDRLRDKLIGRNYTGEEIERPDGEGD